MFVIFLFFIPPAVSIDLSIYLSYDSHHEETNIPILSLRTDWMLR